MHSLAIAMLLGAVILVDHGAEKTSNLDQDTLRSTEADVDLVALGQITSGNDTVVILDFFADLSFAFEVETVYSAGASEHEVTCSLSGEPESYAYLSIKGSTVVGEIFANDESVHVVMDSLGSGRVEIKQESDLSVHVCNAGANLNLSPCPANSCPECFAYGIATSPTTLSVLFGFSQQMAAKFGNDLSRLEGIAARNIALANRIESRSNSFVRYELADVMVSSFDEGPSGSRSPDLQRELDLLQAGFNGLSDIHNARQIVEANIAALVLEGPPAGSTLASGNAAAIGAYSSGAFFVLRHSIGDGFNTAHEIGHLLGLHHPETCGITPYARGYYFGPLDIFSTVMVGSKLAATIRRRSSPDVSWPLPFPLGWTIGDPNLSNEVRLVNETAKYARSWTAPPLGKFEVLGSNGQPLMQVSSGGGVLLRGDIHEFASTNDLNSTYEDNDFLVKEPGQSSNLMRIDGETGDLYLKGGSYRYAARNLRSSINQRPEDYCFVLRNADEIPAISLLIYGGDLNHCGILVPNHTGPWL